MAVIAVAPPSAAGRLAALPPLSLYVHIPWCVRKCPYCDFNSHEVRGEGATAPEADYVAALIDDLDQSLPQIWGRRVYSIFFGGGTPSLFSGASIDALLSAFRARLSLAADCEITLEANPGTVEADRFRDFRAAGVNRLSLGIQSFNPRHLKALGRIHDDTEARRAIELAQKNFGRVNLDLMYALPRQTVDEALADVNEALSTGVTHLSFYHLTIEPNTLFHRHPPAIPDADAAAGISDAVESALVGAGHEHYETSAFARPGSRCRHNVNYWQFGDYLGIGAGAHSKISFPDRILRQTRARTPAEYLRRVASRTAVVEERELGRADRVFEFMMNALRLNHGFAPSLFAERTGLSIGAAERGLAEAEARGLIARSHDRIVPTVHGRHFLNDLLQIFLDDDS